MNATAQKQAPETPRPSIEAHEESLRRWTAKVAALGEDLAKTEAELEQLETQAAQAALEGKKLPDMGDVASRARAIKRARVLAQEHAEEAEEALTSARQAEAQAAAAVVAAEIAREAAGLDDVLSELGHRVATLNKLGQRHNALMAAAGGRRRRERNPIRASDLAGAILHFAPEVFDALETPRPNHNQRKPLADAMAARYGPRPHLEEVK